MNALEIKSLTKKYKGFALDGLDLTLPSGCIMGLIGENGAGKTTTIKLVLNMLKKDGGSITVLGEDYDKSERLKNKIGVVLDSPAFPECLTARQVGRVLQRSFDDWREDEYRSLCERLSLPENKPVGGFSRGMTMKLGIAAALSHGAELLLLDEPTSGLDPVVRDDVLTLLYDFTRDENHSVLISSHIVSDLEKLCDYIAFLHKGKLLLCEEKDILLSKYGVIRCTPEDFSSLPREAVLYKKENGYGIEALVLRSAAAGRDISPVGIEELFVFMARKAA